MPTISVKAVKFDEVGGVNVNCELVLAAVGVTEQEILSVFVVEFVNKLVNPAVNEATFVPAVNDTVGEDIPAEILVIINEPPM